MKSLLPLLFVFSLNAEASFNRLWVGHKRTDISAAQFVSGLNNRLFPDTIHVGGGRGLTSYQPLILNSSLDLPDEIALVMYESEEKYKAIRSTPEGVAYGDLHWDYFQKEVSKSTVAVPFTGQLSVGAAFQLNPQFSGWKEGSTLVGLYRVRPTDLKNLSKIFSDRKREAGINDSILLVTETFVIEYSSYKRGTPMRQLPLRPLMLKALPNSSLGGKVFGPNEGVNVRF